MKIIPAKGWVVLRPTGEYQSSTGLEYTSSEKAATKPITGVVVEIGAGELPLPIKIGDLVLHERYTDNPETVEGVEYNFVLFSHLIAKLVKDKNNGK